MVRTCLNFIKTLMHFLYFAKISSKPVPISSYHIEITLVNVRIDKNALESTPPLFTQISLSISIDIEKYSFKLSSNFIENRKNIMLMLWLGYVQIRT